MNFFFNTAGHCIPGEHYMLDPLPRLKDVEQLIENKYYFTLHAPRQTGKTTYLHALSQKLNKNASYITVTVSFERAGFEGISIESANIRILANIYSAALEQLESRYRPKNPKNENFIDLKEYLQTWSRNQSKPIVLLIDEIDSLLNEVLISVLRQLRDGYQSRPKNFPSSVVLVGVRDVRDYKVHIREDRSSLGTASPFNIKSDSLFLQNFSKQEVFQLLEQHTKETGQEFPVEVREEVFQLSNGQPWLTNALARQMIEKILKNDYSKKITMDLLVQAKQQLILRRDTHLDSLAEKLKEDRVKRIVQAIINGDNLVFDILNDDISYVRDLGIVSPSPPMKFANPIYTEIIPRMMASPIDESIPEEISTSWFLNNKNELDMVKVLKAFQEFYIENSEIWLERYAFKESGNQLLLMAFLQRLVNSGGEIIREMAAGRGRIDLMVKFNLQRVAMELKINRGSKSIEKAKDQLVQYLDRFGLSEGFLVIFDPSDKAWEEKLYMKDITHNNKKITMVGL
jgi:hypothetical protein